MTNPYEPPKGIAPKSYWKRLKKGFAMAAAEYRAGLKRDGFDGWTHLQAWLGLVVTAFLMLLATIAVVVIAVVNAGIFK